MHTVVVRALVGKRSDTFKIRRYDYKIQYNDISKLFLLEKPDERYVAFVVSLDKPIRQGQQKYQHLVLRTTKVHAVHSHCMSTPTVSRVSGVLASVCRAMLILQRIFTHAFTVQLELLDVPRLRVR